MKTEKQLQNYIKTTAKRNGIGFYKLECAGQTGFPDVLLAYNGHSLYVELKSPAGTGRLSPRQGIMLAKLTSQGLETYVIDNKQDADALITGLINRRPAERCGPLI
jgi:hypothetical protein